MAGRDGDHEIVDNDGEDKPKVDLTGLASELENVESVRSYMRRDEKEPLFQVGVNVESVHAVKDDHVYDILKVLLSRTAVVEGHPSLLVVPLREELATLYQKCSRVVDDVTIHNDSWAIRKIIAFIKMKVRRCKVSTATLLNFDAPVSVKLHLSNPGVILFAMGTPDFLAASCRYAKVYRFQELCLILNPFLEDLPIRVTEVTLIAYMHGLYIS